MMKEQNIITLANGNRYYLADQVEDLEGYENTDFFLAVGVTEDDGLDPDEVIFLSHKIKEDGKEVVSKVDEHSELYEILKNIEAISVAMENVPGYAEEFEKILEQESAKSGN